MSLTNVVSKITGSIIIRCLSRAREQQARENQTGFRPGRGCIDQIFTLRQALEHRHAYRRPTIAVFLDLKAAFDSVDREVLWQCLSMKGVPSKYITLLKALYSNTCRHVRAYGELSRELYSSSRVRQGCPLSPFLFNFIIDILMEVSLSSPDYTEIGLIAREFLLDLEHADDVVLLWKMQSLLDSLSGNFENVWDAFLTTRMQIFAPELVFNGVSANNR
ncbi:unnamed protein product, partial [Heterobilharzia americana]